MIEILSHRGFWDSPIEKNSKGALAKSFQNNFGVETDIRDYGGKLVVSHDIPNNSSVLLSELFSVYQENNSLVQIALNIKADGLSFELKKLLEQYSISNYFCFDMSIPETINYLRNDLLFFTRQSEIEREPVLYDKAAGVWIDGFYSDWVSYEVILEHVHKGKKVCLVSPELHKRAYKEEWTKYKEWLSLSDINFMMCTDYPALAWEYFNG